MFKTIVTIIITVIIVLFAMQNFDHVPVYIFSGKAVNIRLIFVMAISGATGYLIRHFVGISREERLKRQIQVMRKGKQNVNMRKRTFKNNDL